MIKAVKPPSLRLVLSVFFGLGPVLMGPLLFVLYIGTGGAFKGNIVDLLIGSMMLPLLWWFGAIVGAPFGSWIFTLAPTFAAAFLFWLASRIIASQRKLQFEKKMSRVTMSCALGGGVSAISFTCITLPLITSHLKDRLPAALTGFLPPFREDLFFLVLVIAIGIGLGAILAMRPEGLEKKSE
ncbi:hypothetical protein [Collimonas pratensis]|uniref:hypothetical protein n=1 Tax=Collimonas pratensis TaxID=279113 RepID=UPI000780F5BB|nr:hypothetical protein [Collimonas pratensis]